PVTGIGGKLRLDAEFQPVVEPVFQLVDGGFAAAEREIVLELQLAAFDDRAADLEVLGLRRQSASADCYGRRQNRAADRADHAADANQPHAQLLAKLRHGK